MQVGAICYWEFPSELAIAPEELRAHMARLRIGAWYPQRVARIATVRRTGKLAAADLTRLFVSNITKGMQGIALKSTGGVYYVPAIHARQLLAHAELARALAGRFVVLELAQSPGNTAALSRAARGALGAHAAALAEQARQAVADPPRQSTLRRRLAALRDLARILTHYELDLSGTVAEAIATTDRVLLQAHGIRTARRIRKTK